MPRILHMADVHLGARHHDLGNLAAHQRERQFEAFRRGIDLAIEERVDLVLVAGDLFDSNSQPRRSVERAAGEFRRLVAGGIRTVLIPGTHDTYDASSLYRVFDLPMLSGLAPGSRNLVVLTPDRPEIVYPAIDVAVYGRVFATKRAPTSPLSGFSSAGETRVRWRIGLIHGSLRIPGRVEMDDVLFTEEEVAASGLHYLALGHWHSFVEGRAGSTVWAYAGAPEPVAVDQDGAGQVLLVTLEDVDGRANVRIERRVVGRTRFRRLELDGGELASQDALVRRLEELADSDLVLDVRVMGVVSDRLDLHEDEVERALSGRFLGCRVRNLAVPAPTEGPLPPPDTIAGAFERQLTAEIAAAEVAGSAELAGEYREALRLGRLLLDDPDRVTLV
ncbi:MAG: DNA repair exonuclease [Chloroflexi bacterium]|nr:DNA repair exonuclease [Chloroflexota bacterium]